VTKEHFAPVRRKRDRSNRSFRYKSSRLYPS